MYNKQKLVSMNTSNVKRVWSHKVLELMVSFQFYGEFIKGLVLRHLMNYRNFKKKKVSGEPRKMACHKEMFCHHYFLIYVPMTNRLHHQLKLLFMRITWLSFLYQEIEQYLSKSLPNMFTISLINYLQILPKLKLTCST